MSKILPIEFRETKIGRTIAVFFVVLAAILSVQLVNSGMEIKYTAFIFAGAIVFARGVNFTD